MTFTGLLANKVVVAVLAFVVSLGAALGISRALTGGGTQAALPETAETVPIIAPIASGPIPSADDPVSVPGAGTAGGGSGGSAGADGGLELSPVVAESTDFAGDVGDLAGGIEGDGDELPTFPGVMRFIDDCAGAEPGAVPPEGCPDPATGGTVLALRAPSPQWVGLLPVPFGEWTSRCHDRALEEDTVPYAAITLNPGTVLLEYWPRQEGAPAAIYPDAAHPSPITTVEASSVSDESRERELWNGWFEDESLGLEPAKHMQHCIALSGLADGRLYDYRLTSTDIFDSSATQEGSFVGAESRRRPPVTITRPGPLTIQVRVPVRTSERERALVLAVPHSGPDESTCADQEAAGIPEHYRRGVTTDVPDATRSADGYVYDPLYDQATSFRFDLAEGRTYSVCIWWQSGPERSFDSARINEREEQFVTAANRYRFRATLERLTFTDDVNAGTVGLDVLSPSGATLCPTHHPAANVRLERATVGRERTPVVLEPGDVICDLTSDERSVDFLDAVDLRVTGPDGPDRLSRLALDTRPCSGCAAERSELFHVAIPGARLEDSVGTALVRVDLIDGPNEGGEEMALGVPRVFFGEGAPAPETVEYAQIDSFTSRAQTILNRTDALRIVANLDRPARVRASVHADPVEGPEPPCLLPGASGSAADEALVASHDFVLDGLCAGHLYFVALEITDAEGDTSYAAWREGLTAAPFMTWEGNARTTPIRVTLSARLVVTATPFDGVNYVYGHVRFGGSDIFRSTIASCVQPNDTLAEVNNLSRDLSNEVLVTVDLVAGPACNRDSTLGSTSFREMVSVAELLAGTVPLTSPDGHGLRVRLELSAIDRA